LNYGVIICPKCGRARGVEAHRKTTTCQCGRQIRLTRMKLRFVTDSPHELAQTVANVNASLEGAGPMPRARKKRKRAAEQAISQRTSTIKDPLERMRAVVAELIASKQELDQGDMRKAAAILGKKDPEALTAKLLELGIIYEVGPGKFRQA
jgi:hypothetical protein